MSLAVCIKTGPITRKQAANRGFRPAAPRGQYLLFRGLRQGRNPFPALAFGGASYAPGAALAPEKVRAHRRGIGAPEGRARGVSSLGFCWEDYSPALSSAPPPLSIMAPATRPALARIFCSISPATCGFSLRNALAFSRPWPMRWPL